MTGNNVKQVLKEAREFIAKQLQAEIDTHEVCAKLRALVGLPENEEIFEAQREEALLFQKKRQAKIESLLKRIDGLIKQENRAK